MAIQIQGNAGVVAEVDSTHRAQRITPRPIDVGSLGAYSLLATTGTMAAGLGASAPIFSARWTSASSLALIRAVRISLTSLGTAFTAGVGFFDIIAARTFTASDSAGTAVLPTGNSNKRRTSFATTGFGDLRISSTATLTAGTRTLDGAALSGVRFGVTAVANTTMLSTAALWAPDIYVDLAWPLVLAQNEGFIIRATVPATGTWQADIIIDWDEIVNTNF